jgi:hypothetical protein
MPKNSPRPTAKVTRRLLFNILSRNAPWGLHKEACLASSTHSDSPRFAGRWGNRSFLACGLCNPDHRPGGTTFEQPVGRLLAEPRQDGNKRRAAAALGALGPIPHKMGGMLARHASHSSQCPSPSHVKLRLSIVVPEGICNGQRSGPPSMAAAFIQQCWEPAAAFLSGRWNQAPAD